MFSAYQYLDILFGQIRTVSFWGVASNQGALGFTIEAANWYLLAWKHVVPIREYDKWHKMMWRALLCKWHLQSAVCKIKSTVCSRGRLFMSIGCIKELFFAVQKNELHQQLGEHPSKTFNHQKAQNLTLCSPSSLETYMARLKSEIRCSFFGHQLAMVPAVQEVNSSPFRTSKLHRREIFQALRP